MQADKTRVARPRLSILVVDDEFDTVLTWAEMLRDEGHIVHTCTSSKVVMEVIQRRRPDVCLLDIVMPGKTGFTIAREVLAMMLKERPVLIAMSGVFSSQSDEVVARSAGFDHFIHKGTEPTKLLQLLDRLAGGPSSPATA